jgi:hypothetical protein
VPTMVYSVAIVLAWLATKRSQLRSVSAAHWLAAGLVMAILVFLLYLPVVLVSGPELLLGNSTIAPLSWSEFAAQLPDGVGGTWALWNRDLPLWVSLLLVVGFIVATVRRLDGPVPMLVLVLGACLPLVIAQHGDWYARVWLFLLPLYLVVASAGVAWLLQQLLQQHLSPVIMLSAGSALAVVLSSVTLTSTSPLISQAEFLDGEPVARTLAGQIGDDDLVLATLPEDVGTGSLAYYFYRAGVPLNTLARPPDTARRLFVVVPLDASDTLLNLMRKKDVRLGDWGPPVLLGRYAHSELYVVDRRQS